MQRLNQRRVDFAAQRLIDLHKNQRKPLASERQVDSGSDWPVRPLIQLVAEGDLDFAWVFIGKC